MANTNIPSYLERLAETCDEPGPELLLAIAQTLEQTRDAQILIAERLKEQNDLLAEIGENTRFIGRSSVE